MAKKNYIFKITTGKNYKGEDLEKVLKEMLEDSLERDKLDIKFIREVID